jgi:hypothetical protein
VAKTMRKEITKNILRCACSLFILALSKDKLQEWTGHSTLISENLKLVEISKKKFNTI